MLLGLGAVGSGVLYWVDRRWGMRWRTEPKGGHETAEAVNKVDEEAKGHGTAKSTDGGVENAVTEGETKV